MDKPRVEQTVETTKNTVKTYAITSQQLLGATGKISIQHNGEIYQLRQTRAGKLILTK